MKIFRKYSIILMVFLAAVFVSHRAATAAGKGMRGAKNIILMVPDGMGLSYVTATRIFKNGPDGSRLNFEALPEIGYQRTHSKNSTVTDSAAAASAWASGAKYNNGEISCHDDNFDGACDSVPVPTILDIAQSMGKATGLVATSDITHATPAAFGANVHNRKCEEEIARQYIERGIDVLLGGGIAKNRSSCVLTPSAPDYLDVLLNDAAAAGYAVAMTKAEMDVAVSGGAGKILGLFKSGGKTPELFRVDPLNTYPETEPTLPEMTEAALDVLEKDKDGFFCMIEGSQIDWAGHANDMGYLLGEMLAFDEAVKTVQEWVAARPLRKMHTLIIVVGDHETGGMMIDGPYGTLSEAGDIIDAGWTSGDHSAQDTVIWSQGPGSCKLGTALDNTDLYQVMVDMLR